MRLAISSSSSLGVKSTRRLTKLKRTPRTPASCSSLSSASLMLRLTVAMPLARPLEDFSASTMARLSAPWQVACTTTFLSKPRWSRSANSWSLEASQGVYLRSGANGNWSPGPNTWQCASTLPGGTLKRGFDGPAYQSSQPGVLVNVVMVSVQGDVGLADHVAETLGLGLDELVELVAGRREGLIAEALELLLHVGAGQRGLDVLPDLVGDGRGQARRHRDRVPARDLEALRAARLAHRRHVREAGQALRRGHGQEAQLAGALQRARGGGAAER